MAKKHIASKLFEDADMRPQCSVCNRNTPYLFKGIRYCADHHPDPGAHIHAQARAA
jgi:hypothetical protein